MLIRTLIDFSVYKQSYTKFLRIGTDDNETINETANNSLSLPFPSPKRRIDNETEAVT